MAVNKPGRPSKAAERRAEILQAMARVVARTGLARDTTVGAVADEAGMQRTLVFHYFGDRRGLLDAFVNHILDRHGRRVLGDDTEPIRARIDRMFDPEFHTSRDDLVVWIELIALSAHDDSVRNRLRTLWLDRWLPEIERQLARAAPRATTEDIAQVAYGLTCLAEAHWALTLQGLDSPQRRGHAQAAARTLIATLPLQDP